MQGFTPAFPGLYTEDIVELVNVPHTDWPQLIPQYPRFRIKHDTEDEFGYEQIFTVREGVIVRSLDLLMLRDNTVSVSALSGYVSFFFHLNGGCLLLTEGEEHPHNSGSGGVYYDSVGELSEDFSRAGVNYAFFEVLIDKQLLLDEFFSEGLQQMPAVLRPLYEDNKNYNHHTTSLDSEVHQAVQVLAATDYQGVLRDKFIEAKSMELICLMLRVLLRQEQEIAHRPLSVRDTDLLEQAREMLAADLSTPPTVDAIAQALGISKSVLQERFKQLFGMSLRNYLVKKRMEKARDLLRLSELNINQISWQLGYEHSCNFVTAFKRQYGMTPNAYRKLAANTY
ncbi:AraC family transcriptional regulator [Dasania marina]|uniref:helix-turn-helix transcriptional regulator n=1 Tax=Dasania marina TaxID=471499 RepID=UPI0030DD665B|tara:strand:- start:4521 stop:5540 length:1020 start_codon:yes stop_codon:yes gene_type:complete